MDLFQDRTERLERNVKKLEDRIGKINASINIMIDVVKKLSEERGVMAKERDSLRDANRKLLALVPHEQNKLSKDIFRKFIKPSIESSAELVRMSTNKNVSLLFDEIMEKGEITVRNAARKLGVYEGQIEEWAKFLEDNGLVSIVYEKGRVLAMKKSF